MNQSIFEEKEPVRLGVLVPSVNTVVEPDMYRMTPSGFTTHFSRLPVPSDESTVENLERLEDHLDEALQSLAQARVKAVAFACTSGSFIKGPEWDRHLIERMEKIVRPAITTSEAVVTALRTLGLVKLALVTPYPDLINERMQSYFHAREFRIVSLKSFSLTRSYDMKRASPKAIFELAKSADSKDSEGIFISCTDLQALPVIDALEKSVRKPVISSNQATFWRLLTLSGESRSVKGYGRLLEGISQKG